MLTNPKTPQIRAYLRSFNYTDSGMDETQEVETGDYVRTSDYLLCRQALEAEIEQLRAALKVAQQAILEFSHAQECGPRWYTRGADGMYAQVHMWLHRGLEAVRSALGPYADNGQYLKEMPAVEPSVADKIAARIEDSAPARLQKLNEAAFAAPQGIMGTDCPYGNPDCPHCHAENRPAEGT